MEILKRKGRSTYGKKENIRPSNHDLLLAHRKYKFWQKNQVQHIFAKKMARKKPDILGKSLHMSTMANSWRNRFF